MALENAINQIVGVVTVGLFAARPADLVILGGPGGRSALLSVVLALPPRRRGRSCITVSIVIRGAAMKRRNFVFSTVAASLGALVPGQRAPRPSRPCRGAAASAWHSCWATTTNVIDTAGPWEVFQDVGGDDRPVRMPSPFELVTVGPSRDPLAMTCRSQGQFRLLPSRTHPARMCSWSYRHSAPLRRRAPGCARRRNRPTWSSRSARALSSSRESDCWTVFPRPRITNPGMTLRVNSRQGQARARAAIHRQRPQSPLRAASLRASTSPCTSSRAISTWRPRAPRRAIWNTKASSVAMSDRGRPPPCPVSAHGHPAPVPDVRRMKHLPRNSIS